jgi:hypothetical protein
MSSLPPLALSLLVALPLRPALADEPKGYVSDIDGRCALWAPSMLDQREYAVRYAGACRNGRAEGPGRAEWLFRYARTEAEAGWKETVSARASPMKRHAEMKVKAIWEGEFRNGVFLGGQEIKGWVEPVPGDRYVVAMGKVEDAGLFFVSRGPQDGPMALCRIDRVALVLGVGTDAADDGAVRRLMESGAKFYRETCPQGSRTPEVGVFTEAVAARPNGMLPNPVAQARYDADAGALTTYRNEAADKAREARRRAEFAQRQEEARERFDEFSTRNGIAAWVTTRQLDENPFRWQGKTVGVVVRLERMLTPDAALVRSGLNEWSQPVQLAGITPDFPESRRTVLVAAQIGDRRPAADGSDAAVTYATLRHVDSRVCASDGCGDWLLWARGERRLIWGEPFPPR